MSVSEGNKIYRGSARNAASMTEQEQQRRTKSNQQATKDNNESKHEVLNKASRRATDKVTRNGAANTGILHKSTRDAAPLRGEKGSIGIEIKGGARVGGLRQTGVVRGEAGEPFGHSDRCDTRHARPQTSCKEPDLVLEGGVSVYETLCDGYIKLGFRQEPEEPEEVVAHVIVGGHNQRQEAQARVVLVLLVVIAFLVDGLFDGVVVPLTPAPIVTGAP